MLILTIKIYWEFITKTNVILKMLIYDKNE